MERTHRSKWHNGNERESKTKGSIPIEIVGDDTERHENEQDIDPRPKEEISIGRNPGRLTRSLEYIEDARGK